MSTFPVRHSVAFLGAGLCGINQRAFPGLTGTNSSRKNKSTFFHLIFRWSLAAPSRLNLRRDKIFERVRLFLSVSASRRSRYRRPVECETCAEINGMLLFEKEITPLIVTKASIYAEDPCPFSVVGPTTLFFSSSMYSMIVL